MRPLVVAFIDLMGAIINMREKFEMSKSSMSFVVQFDGLWVV